MARTTIPAELVAINAIQGTLIADNAITAIAGLKISIFCFAN